MTRRVIAGAAAAALAMSAAIAAQGGRPASPAGSSATQVGGKYVPGSEGPVYQGASGSRSPTAARSNADATCSAGAAPVTARW